MKTREIAANARRAACFHVAMHFATLRIFRHHRMEAVLAIMALAAGIGFSTTLFSIVKAVSFSEPPIPGSRQIVRIQTTPTDTDSFAKQQTVFEGVAGIVTTGGNVSARNSTERMRVAWVSPNFLDLVRIAPAIGAGLHSRESVVIGDRLWHESFGADPAVSGRTLLLNGEPRTITGVMPASFAFPRGEQVWAAWEFSPAHPITQEGRGSDAFILGRLKPGRTVDQARLEMNVIWKRLTETRTHQPEHGSILVLRFSEMNVKGEVKTLVATVLCACLCVLLIACADVAHLHLARAARRMGEFAVRSALGASRGQIVSGLLKESLLLSAVGAVGGVLFSIFALRLFRSTVEREALLTQSDRPWVHFELDGTVLLFVVGLTLVAALAAGLFPALRVSGLDLESLLRDSGGTTSLRSGRFGRLLVHIQLAGAVVLLTAAGLVGTVALRFNQHLEFNPSHLATARISLDPRDYPDAASRIRFFEQVEAEAARLPGVEAAALTNAEHFTRAGEAGIEVEGQPQRADGSLPASTWQAITPHYFDIYSSSVLAGRGFTPHDGAGTAPVAIVNRPFARRHWPAVNPIGKRFRALTGSSGGQWLQVVGVSKEIASVRMGQGDPEPAFYVPLAQAPTAAVSVLLRTHGDALAPIPALRAAVEALNRDVPVYQVFSAAEIMDIEGIGIRIPTVMFAACGVFALLLGALGAWGVLSLTARQRTREIGIRLALGATPDAVLSLMLRDGAKQVVGGVALGALLGAILSRILASLFGAFDRQWAVFAVVVSTISVVSLMALWGPSRTASKLSPLDALRVS